MDISESKGFTVLQPLQTFDLLLDLGYIDLSNNLFVQAASLVDFDVKIELNHVHFQVALRDLWVLFHEVEESVTCLLLEAVVFEI